MRSKRSGIAVVLLLALIGCTGNPEQRFRAQAEQIRLRIAPSRSTASELAVMRTGTGFSATWDVHSDLKRDVLESQLTETLKPDFAMTSEEPDQLRFAKYDDGESRRLAVNFTSEADGRTMAHVQLTIAPD